MIAKNSILTDLLKQQLKHSEKNVIDLEDTSDFDSASDIENSEDVQIEEGYIQEAWTKPIDASLVLKKVVKAYYNRPSVLKKRA